MIFEIMGRPAEYIKETLSQLVDKIKDEKGCCIVDKKVFEPKVVEQHHDIFTTFAEVEMTFERIEDLLKVVFSYLPSHVDIVKPQQSALTNIEMNYLVNELAATLHKYDEVAKRMMLDNDALKRMMEQKAAEPVAETIERKEDALLQETKKKEEKKTAKKRGLKKKEKILDKTADGKGKKKEELAEMESGEEETKVKDKAEVGNKEKVDGEEEESINEAKNPMSDDPDGIYQKEMSQEEEEYLDDLDEALDEDEGKEKD